MKPTADERYQELQKEVTANIEEVIAKLAKHAEEQKKSPKNWGNVGDLAHYNDLLKQLLNKE